ncbi:hypothetical protein LTR86_008052 [Recurvomyces mirabilis]|nr:hypothetical protein LTR86_008052 [Recurvomyces mirabilis]
MRSTIIAASLFAGAAFALPSPQETDTVYDTEIFTITSCGPEVTNCPARATTSTSVRVSTVASAVPTSWGPPGHGGPGGYGSWSSSTAAPSTTSSAPVSTSTIVTSSSVVVSSSTSVASVSSPVAPVSSSASWSAPAPPAYSSWASSPLAPVSSAPAVPSSPVAPYPMSSGVWSSPAGPVMPYPTGTGPPSKSSGYASGTGGISSNTSVPAPYTGSASGFKVAGSLVGAGAFAALFL